MPKMESYQVLMKLVEKNKLTKRCNLTKTFGIKSSSTKKLLAGKLEEFKDEDMISFTAKLILARLEHATKK